MDFGSFVLAWATFPLVLSMAGYLMVAVGVREFRVSSRVVYWILFAMAFAAFIDLFRLFITDQFQFSYISSYSSSDLTNSWPHFYKISALWAGQQGTFLLWLVFGLALGFWVKAKAGENEGWVMFFYILGQTFLLVLTIISNPFEKLDFIPPDGQGLNPLLQNYWMQIHPPIVFIGFAAACIPFAFAMASLATNKYNDWVKQTMPWVVFTVVTLGLGIFLGGYWAYETLGWGGYWAWDPVENSSLIPWLVSIALVHGMVMERARGTWRRTNLFLAITMFLLIIYGTFLTRSGVLADFSVHSFVDLGYNNILWGSIIVMGVISYGLWIMRAVKMKVPAQTGTSIFSQEFTTFLSMILLLPFTLLVLFWTSFPLITTIIAGIPWLSKIAPTPAAISPINYNIAGIIFSVIFSIVLGLNALLSWRDADMSALKKKLLIPSIIALTVSAVFIILGFSRISRTWASPEGGGSALVIIMAILYFLFFFTAMFSTVTNFLLTLRKLKSNFTGAGGFLTHFGFSLMLIGIILSSGFGDSKKVPITEGGSGSALGYNISFDGTERTTPKEETARFELTKDKDKFKAVSVSKEVIRGNQTQYVRTPFIKKHLLYDLYLSMENLTDANEFGAMPFELKSGESTSIPGATFVFDGYDSDRRAKELAAIQGENYEVTKGNSVTINGAKVTFDGFDMSQHQDGGMGGAIGAKLKVAYKGKSYDIIPTYTPMQSSSSGIEFPSGGYLSLTKIKADVGGIVLAYAPGRAKEDLEVGTVINVITGTDTTIVVPVFNPSTGHSEKSVALLPDGGTITLMDLRAKENIAQFVYTPPEMPRVASIAISTKPMINLVWAGLLLIVIGSGIAVIRRMRDTRHEE